MIFVVILFLMRHSLPMRSNLFHHITPHTELVSASQPLLDSDLRQNEAIRF